MPRLLLLAMLLLAMGCNEDRFLSGQWILSDGGKEAVDGRLLGCEGSAADCKLWMEVNLGHFGEEVVGVVRWYSDQNRFKRATCDAKAPQLCCSYIEGGFRDNAFVFEFRELDGAIIRHTIVADSGSELSWRLSREGLDEQILHLIPNGQPSSDDKLCIPPDEPSP